MRNADFRMADLRAGDFPVLSVAGGASGAGRVAGNGAAAGVADAPRFGALYQELQREVTRYIEQGAGEPGDGATALSAEGAWRRQQMPAMWQEPRVGADGPTASPAQQQAFVDEVLPLAREAAGRLGVAPEVLTAQAALETGWGRSPLRRADGTSSHNLFGIKATGPWSGEVAQAMTTEFEDGQAVARPAAFRAYATPAQSFNDLASLISGSQRYQDALGTGSDARAYGQALQRGGYATDPAYAEKLARVAARIQGGGP